MEGWTDGRTNTQCHSTVGVCFVMNGDVNSCKFIRKAEAFSLTISSVISDAVIQTAAQLHCL